MSESPLPDPPETPRWTRTHRHMIDAGGQCRFELLLTGNPGDDAKNFDFADSVLDAANRTVAAERRADEAALERDALSAAGVACGPGSVKLVACYEVEP